MDQRVGTLASVTSEVHSVKPRHRLGSLVTADCAHLPESESDVRMKMPNRAPSRAAQGGPASMTCLVFVWSAKTRKQL